MKSIAHHPQVGDITICQSLRSRRITLSVRPTGEIRLSFPPYISQRRALEFLDSKVDWILKTKARYAMRNTPSPLSKSEIEALREQAKQYLPMRVKELAEVCYLTYGDVRIRAARTKWGSCTAQNNISLSLFLMTLPPHLQDYVIIHELCHTVHHNHSPRFHALVNRLVGGIEKELAKELRGYSIR